MEHDIFLAAIGWNKESLKKSFRDNFNMVVYF